MRSLISPATTSPSNSGRWSASAQRVEGRVSTSVIRTAPLWSSFRTVEIGLGFTGRAGPDGEGMQATLERVAHGLVDDPMALDAALALEGRGYDINGEVSLPALAPARMADMLVRFVQDRERDWVQTLAERPIDPV